MTTTVGTLPERFRALEPWVTDWALATRVERYEKRLSKTIDELQDFYDAITPYAEDATRLLHLLYSAIIEAYPVNIFKQIRIPDPGAAFFGTAREPAI